MALSVEDDVTNRGIHYNFIDNAIGGYKYSDREYSIVTNLLVDPNHLIQRAEEYKGFQWIYSFFADGTAEISTVNAEVTDTK
ncbi:MAG: hypothetical protein LBQ46_09600 [Treponema sp.]|nr:hypothetical protein [Treponema sp.]